MKRLGVITICVAVFALISVVVWQQSRLQQAKTQIAHLEEQVATAIPALQKEKESLREQLQEATGRVDSNMSELLRLRGQSVKMRQLEQDIVNLEAGRDRLSQPREQSRIEESEEANQDRAGSVMDQNFGVGTQDLMAQARDWASTLKVYAKANEGQYPSNLGDAFGAADWLPHENRARMATGINRFELVYHGAASDLESLPTESIIVVRERQAWVGADGKWHKIYGMAPGNSQLVTKDMPGLFSDHEAVRIVQ